MATTRRTRRGGYPRSICPLIPTPELCGGPLCKWNVKLSRCRKAPKKRATKSASNKAK